MDITHKLLISSLRPVRIVVFFDKTDEDWRDTVTSIIEIFSTLWGGFGNLIIPTVKDSIEAPFQEILKQYDADIYYYYQKTELDDIHKRSNQKAYLEEIENCIHNLNMSPKEAEMYVDRPRLRKANTYSSFTQTKLADEISHLNAPFRWRPSAPIMKITKFQFF